VSSAATCGSKASRLFAGPRNGTSSRRICCSVCPAETRESLVDRTCIAAAFRGASALPAAAPRRHVHASTLGRDHGFSRFSDHRRGDGIAPPRINRDRRARAAWDNVSFQSSLEQLRQLSAIALDDVGLGQSNFRCPRRASDLPKLDRYFIDGCANDRHRRAVISALRQLALDFHAEIIAEGVENADDSITLQGLGISLMQGFYFSEPLAAVALLEFCAA
jgi:EAL domain-containing protein (putative c-di-GMP-specific phosphodiesterase class I)